LNICFSDSLKLSRFISISLSQSNTFVELKLEDIYVDGVKIDKIASWSYVSSTITSPQPPPPEEEPEDPENPEEGNNDPNEGNTEDEGEKNE